MTTQELSRLHWQCRRGSLELDLLVNTYLHQYYIAADAAEKQWFSEQLLLDDLDLMASMQARLSRLSTLNLACFNANLLSKHHS
jgi:antitoxin CptB